MMDHRDTPLAPKDAQRVAERSRILVVQLAVLALCAVTLGFTSWEALLSQKSSQKREKTTVGVSTLSLTTLPPTSPLFSPSPILPPATRPAVPHPPLPTVPIIVEIAEAPVPFPFDLDVYDEHTEEPKKTAAVSSDLSRPWNSITETLAQAVALAGTDPLASRKLCVDVLETLGSRSGNMAVWDQAESLLRSLLFHGEFGETLAESLPDIVAFAASRSGRFVIAVCGDGSLRLYDTESRTASPLAASTTPVVSVALTPDDRFAIAGFADGTITWWRTRRNPNAPHDAFILPNRLPGLRHLELSADGRWMVAFAGNHDAVTNSTNRPALDRSCLWLWDLTKLSTNPLAPSQAWDEPIPIRGHVRPVRVVAFSRDARWLVVGSEDRQTRLYDLHAEVIGMGQCILKGHQQDVCAIAIAPDRSWIATGSYDSTIRIWDFTTDTPAPLATLTGHCGWISALTALDQHTLISGGYDQQVYLWDVAALRATGSLTAVQLTSNIGTVRAIALSDDARFLAILGGRSSLQLWRICTGSAELLEVTDAVPLAGIAFDRAGRLLQATRAPQSAPSAAIRRLPMTAITPSMARTLR